MASSDPAAPGYEAQHVHGVYEEIASHFSATRYKVSACLSLVGAASNMFFFSNEKSKRYQRKTTGAQSGHVYVANMIAK